MEKRVYSSFHKWADKDSAITAADAAEAIKDLKLKVDPKAFVAALDKYETFFALFFLLTLLIQSRSDLPHLTKYIK